MSGTGLTYVLRGVAKSCLDFCKGYPLDSTDHHMQWSLVTRDAAQCSRYVVGGAARIAQQSVEQISAQGTWDA